MINLKTGEAFTPPPIDPADEAIANFHAAASFVARQKVVTNEHPAGGAEVYELLLKWRSVGFRRLLVRHIDLELSKKGLYSKLYGGQKWLQNLGLPEQQSLASQVMFQSHPDGYVLVQRAGHVKAASLAAAAAVLNEVTPAGQVIADLIDFIANGPVDSEFARPCTLAPALFEFTDAELAQVDELTQHAQLMIVESTPRRLQILKLSPTDV